MMRAIALALGPGLPGVQALGGEDSRSALGVNLGVVEILHARRATVLACKTGVRYSADEAAATASAGVSVYE